jgi:hypothetical protein
LEFFFTSGVALKGFDLLQERQGKILNISTQVFSQLQAAAGLLKVTRKSCFFIVKMVVALS